MWFRKTYLIPKTEMTIINSLYRFESYIHFFFLRKFKKYFKNFNKLDLKIKYDYLNNLNKCILKSILLNTMLRK